MESFDQDRIGSQNTHDRAQNKSPSQLSTKPSTINGSPESSRTTWFGWKLTGLGIVTLLAVLYAIVDIDRPNATTDAEIARINSFDPRLLSCNDVITSEPSPAYDTCLSAAQEGQVLAIKRIIWAYSRKSDYQDLGKVFEWLRQLPYKDSATQLLMYSLVHLNAESDKLRKDSELGISRLVAKNYAPANVVLASIYALNENIIPPSSNTLWLLNRAHKKDPVILEPSILALIHANGFVSDINIAAGTNLLKKSAELDFPMAANNIAWFLATLDNNPFTSGEYALSIAQRVVDDPIYGQNPIYVDTLAATFAANNMFEQASKTQQQAIEMLARSNLSESVLNTTQIEYEERLSLYLQNEVLVEENLFVDKSTFFKKIRNRVLEYVLREFFITVEAPVLFNGASAEGSAEALSIEGNVSII
jgi:hypothetical protein